MTKLKVIIVSMITISVVMIGSWFTIDFISQKQPFIVFFFSWMYKVLGFLIIKAQMLLIAAKLIIQKNIYRAVVKTSLTRLAYTATFLFPSARKKILYKKKIVLEFCTNSFKRTKSTWETSTVLTKASILSILCVILAFLGVSILLLPFTMIWGYVKKKLAQSGVEKAWDKLIVGLYIKAPWFKRSMYPFRLIKVYAILTGRKMRIKHVQQ